MRPVRQQRGEVTARRTSWFCGTPPENSLTVANCWRFCGRDGADRVASVGSQDHGHRGAPRRDDPCRTSRFASGFHTTPTTSQIPMLITVRSGACLLYDLIRKLLKRDSVGICSAAFPSSRRSCRAIPGGLHCVDARGMGGAGDLGVTQRLIGAGRAGQRDAVGGPGSGTLRSWTSGCMKAPRRAHLGAPTMRWACRVHHDNSQGTVGRARPDEAAKERRLRRMASATMMTHQSDYVRTFDVSSRIESSHAPNPPHVVCRNYLAGLR